MTSGTLAVTAWELDDRDGPPRTFGSALTATRGTKSEGAIMKGAQGSTT